METSAVNIPASFQELYDILLEKQLANQPKLEYQMQTRDQLAAQYRAGTMPGLEATIAQRKLATQKNNAAIDVDASARGAGQSSYITDVKNRNYQSEARDISGMRGNYYGGMQNTVQKQLSDQESRRLNVDQYNAQKYSEADNRALQLALANYEKWGAPVAQPGGYQPPTDPTVVEGGLTGGVGGGLAAALAALKNKRAPADPYDYTRSYAQQPKFKISGSVGGAVG